MALSLKQWFKQADKGSSPGTLRGEELAGAEEQFLTGQKFAVGQEVAQDFARAAHWYGQAAEQKHSLAQLNLAMLYGQGLGVVRDQAKSLLWLTRSAKLGNPEAQYQLGVRQHLTARARKTAASPEARIEALKWVRLSASQGQREAENACESVALGMTQEQVTEAGRRAVAFAADCVASPGAFFLQAVPADASTVEQRRRQREVSYLRQIRQEKRRSDQLLHMILPEDVAAELKSTNCVQPRRFEDVGVLFCDIVEFTRYCDQHPPEDVVQHLQSVVEAFEEISERHGLEKIKTVGDAFIGTIGLRIPAVNAALSCVSCGLEMIDTAARMPPHWDVQVGVQVGPVIAGVVGRRKYQYDIWGDTVNLAARMASSGKPGCVCLGAETWRLLGGHPQGRAMGCIQVKGKGSLDLFLIGADVGRTCGNSAIPDPIRNGDWVGAQG